MGMHLSTAPSPRGRADSGAVAPAVVSAGLGVLFVPLALFSLVTFGPGFPLLCVAAALIAIGFTQVRSQLATLRRHRGALLATTAGLLGFGVLGVGYLVLAGDLVPRLTGTALVVGAAVLAAWLWLATSARAAGGPSATHD